MYVSHQIEGFSRVVFELLAQLANESPQIFQLASVLRTPHSMQQSQVRNRQAGMRHEIAQEVKLFRRKVNRLAGLANQPASRVKLYITNANYSVRIHLGCVGPPD